MISLSIFFLIVLPLTEFRWNEDAKTENWNMNVLRAIEYVSHISYGQVENFVLVLSLFIASQMNSLDSPNAM